MICWYSIWAEHNTCFYDLMFRKDIKDVAVESFEEYDLWTLNPSGDSSFSTDAVESFWNDVKEELKR